jgi:carbamoyl-phosphate synthase large subunit
MPRRDDLHTILLLGSGPIVIGQACEFDYSGTQAVRALKAEGYRVVLVNNNPASVMTDPRLADRTYVEPLLPATVERVIERERPQALLATMGGQTALNLAVRLAESGVLERYSVELLGARVETIRMAEDRQLFEQTMRGIGIATPRGGFARSAEQARAVARAIGFPLVLRPSFTLGGSGGAVARSFEELDRAVRWALDQSPAGQVLVEESLLGWKEFELEVMRDRADNAVIVCGIENLDPMGIHTGDSITVAPVQTLSDVEYQAMRDDALKAIRALGIETGGCNIQFAVDPRDGKRRVIEVNPRVSRSSALASKATGFPIAKIAARLAVGYTLDELRNDITQVTPASFEPALDYVVVKVPRFAFEKFPGADDTLTTQMKSVGETMAIGRTFAEALGKGLRALEDGGSGLGLDPQLRDPAAVREALRQARPDRIRVLRDGYRAGLTTEELYALTAIDPWFLNGIRAMVEAEEELRRRCATRGGLPSRAELREAKRLGFSDRQLAALCGVDERTLAEHRRAQGVRPVYKAVDTCAAEFEAHTPYLYSCYEDEDEAPRTDRRKVVILGSGPNRIGQGIEFDTCCVEAALALKQQGIETIMVNCNPETVSTDYDVADRLYFEPLTFEDVMEILHRERPDGVIVTLGGQTPLSLARALEREGVPIWGTPAASIDIAEDREKFYELVVKLGLRLPEGAMATDPVQALQHAARIGYPVLVRPSYVLGGRAMTICDNEDDLRAALAGMTGEGPQGVASRVEFGPGRPLLIDRFLEEALEFDVDLLCDGRQAVICGVMQHIEHAGIHSGDSACILPPLGVQKHVLEAMADAARRLALTLRVVGPMNVQFAVQEDRVYVLEANPRSSRTIPFVSRATGRPVAGLAALLMAGKTLAELEVTEEPPPRHVSVKACAFPYHKFPGSDVYPGPEMRSTGESMGAAFRFGPAFAKAYAGIGEPLPRSGAACLSVREQDRMGLVPVATRLRALGFSLFATEGTAQFLREHGFSLEVLARAGGGSPNVVERILARQLQLVLSTPLGPRARRDDEAIRRACVAAGIPFLTTLEAGLAAVAALRELGDRGGDVLCLQELHERRAQPLAGPVLGVQLRVAADHG